jgi:Yip1-like protein
MSDLSAAPPVATEPERPTGFFANLIDLYFSPADAFANLLRKPSFLVPLLVHISLSLLFTGIWLQKVDARAFMRARIEESPRGSQIPPERMEAILSQQETWLPRISWASGVLAPVIIAFALGGLFLFVFRFFYASEIDYKRSMTVVTSSFATLALLTTPLLLSVLALKGDWTIPPQEALQANVTLFLEKSSAPKWLWALGSSLDLFSFWLLFMLATGFAAASKRRWTWALPGVLAPWAMFVIGKVGVSLLQR